MPAVASARLTSAARSGSTRTDSQPSSPVVRRHARPAPAARGAPSRGSTSSGGDPDPDDALAEQELVHRAFADEAARRDDPDDVGELLDLAEDVARDEDGLAGRSEVRSVARMATIPAGSSPLAGSSSRSRRGSLSSAPAIPSRCFIPSE